MNFTAWLDVAIGLAIVYLGASLFVTIIGEYVSQALNLRGKVLWDSLAKLIQDPDLRGKLETAGAQIEHRSARVMELAAEMRDVEKKLDAARAELERMRDAITSLLRHVDGHCRSDGSEDERALGELAAYGYVRARLREALAASPSRPAESEAKP